MNNRITCYDCIHCEACSDAGDTGFSSLKEDAGKCKHFKNKANVVEVVRCKDCAYCDEDRRCEAPVNGLIREYVSPYDYCSYGKRKEPT